MPGSKRSVVAEAKDLKPAQRQALQVHADLLDGQLDGRARGEPTAHRRPGRDPPTPAAARGTLRGGASRRGRSRGVGARQCGVTSVRRVTLDAIDGADPQRSVAASAALRQLRRARRSSSVATCARRAALSAATRRSRIRADVAEQSLGHQLPAVVQPRGGDSHARGRVPDAARRRIQGDSRSGRDVKPTPCPRHG